MNIDFKRPWIVILTLMITAVGISYALFLTQSLRLDEAQTLWQTNRYPAGILHVVGQDVHVPLYHLMVHFWQLLFGNSIEVVRLFSLAFFVASIPVLFLIAQEMFGSKRISSLAATLFTLSPFMNWYGNEARMYSMLVFFTLLNQYYFVRLRTKSSALIWLGYTLTAILGIYTHYYFGLVLVTQALFYLFNSTSFNKGSLWKLLMSALLVLLAIAPWLLYVHHLGSISNSEPLLMRPTLIDIFNTFAQYIFGIQSVPINSFIVALWPLIMLTWLFSLEKRKDRSVDTRYLLLSVIVPIFLSFIISILVRPVFQERYLIYTLPAFSLLIAAMIDSYSDFTRRSIRIGLIVCLLVALVVVRANPNTPTKEDYRAVAEHLHAEANPQDVVIVSAPFTIYPLEYYYQGPSVLSTLPIWNQYVTGPIPPFDSNTFPTQVQTVTGSHQRAWLLLSYDQGYEDAIRTYFDNHYERLEYFTISPKMTLALYKIRYDTSEAIYATPSP